MLSAAGMLPLHPLLLASAVHTHNPGPVLRYSVLYVCPLDVQLGEVLFKLFLSLQVCFQLCQLLIAHTRSTGAVPQHAATRQSLLSCI